MEETVRIDFTDSIDGAKKGELDAFEFLYNHSVQLFKAECMKYFKSIYDIDDALQESYLRIYQKLDTLQDPRAFIGWGQTITRNVCLNMIRTRDTKAGLDDYKPMTSDGEYEGLDSLTAADYRREYNPDAVMDAHAVKSIVDGILDDLPEMQRACIMLWNEDYTYKQIGEQLGIPEGTAKSNVNYAKKKIAAATEKIEKEQGIKLHGKAPLGTFVLLLTYLANNYTPTIPDVGGRASLEAILQTVKGQVAPAVLQSSPTGGQEGGAGANGMQKQLSKTGKANAETSRVFRKVTTEGGKQVTKVLLPGGGTVSLKVLVASLVAAIGIGGVAGFSLLRASDNRKPRETETVGAEVEDANSEVTEASTEEITEEKSETVSSEASAEAWAGAGGATYDPLDSYTWTDYQNNASGTVIYQYDQDSVNIIGDIPDSDIYLFSPESEASEIVLEDNNWHSSLNNKSLITDTGIQKVLIQGRETISDFTFYPTGLLNRIIITDRSGTENDGLFLYDTDGKKKEYRLSGQTLRLYAYNTDGSIKSTVLVGDSTNHVIEFEYHEGKMISAKEKAASGAETYEWRFEYDEKGRVVTCTEYSTPRNERIRCRNYSYDPDGRVETIVTTDADNQKIREERFNYNAIIWEEWSESGTEESSDRLEEAEVYTTRYYSFTMPDVWKGKVDVSIEGDNMKFFWEGVALSSVVVEDSGIMNNQGDISGYRVWYEEEGGVRVLLGVSNYTYLIPASEMMPFDEKLESLSDVKKQELLDLCTGGNVSLKQCRDSYSEDYYDLTEGSVWWNLDTFYKEVIVPCITITVNNGDPQNLFDGLYEQLGGQGGPKQYMLIKGGKIKRIVNREILDEDPLNRIERVEIGESEIPFFGDKPGYIIHYDVDDKQMILIGEDIENELLSPVWNDKGEWNISYTDSWYLSTKDPEKIRKIIGDI